MTTTPQPEYAASPDRLSLARDAVLRWLKGWHPDTRIALGVFIVAALLRLNHLGVLLDNYDEGVYAASLRQLSAGHPLFSSVYSAQPPLFLYSLLPWYLLFGKTLVAARAGVVIYSLVGLIAAWFLARRLGGPRVALIALALLGFDPIFLEQSRLLEAEAPALAFALVALACAAWGDGIGHGGHGSSTVGHGNVREQGVRARPVSIRSAVTLSLWPFLAGAAFTVSVVIKLFTLPVILPLGALLLGSTWGPVIQQALSERQWLRRGELAEAWHMSQNMVVACLAGIAVVVVIVVAPIALGGRLGVAWQQVVGLHIHAAGDFATGRSGNVGLILGAWWELPVIVVGLAVAALALRQRMWPPVIFAGWGVINLLTLFLQTPLFEHHLALISPPFILAAAFLPQVAITPRSGRTSPAMGWLAQWGSSVLAALVVVAIITAVAQQNANQSHQATAYIGVAADLQSFTQPHDLVITDAQIATELARRATPPNLVDTSLVRIASGSLTTNQVIAAASDPQVTAILWYSGRFDHLPGLRAWVTEHFIRAIDYGQGRALYVRAPQTPPLPVG